MYIHAEVINFWQSAKNSIHVRPTTLIRNLLFEVEGVQVGGWHNSGMWAVRTTTNTMTRTKRPTHANTITLLLTSEIYCSAASYVLCIATNISQLAVKVAVLQKSQTRTMRSPHNHKRRAATPHKVLFTCDTKLIQNVYCD